MAKEPTIASAAGIAVTHREREDRPGDFRVSDNVRAAMEEAAAKSPHDREAIHRARKDVLGSE